MLYSLDELLPLLTALRRGCSCPCSSSPLTMPAIRSAPRGPNCGGKGQEDTPWFVPESAQPLDLPATRATPITPKMAPQACVAGREHRGHAACLCRVKLLMRGIGTHKHAKCKADSSPSGQPPVPLCLRAHQ